MTYHYQELPYRIHTWSFCLSKNTNRRALAQKMLKPFFIADKVLRQPGNSVFNMLPYEFAELKEIVKYQGDHNPEIREIISFDNAIVFRTKNHGDFVYCPMSHAVNVKSFHDDDYFKIEHFDPFWGTLYVFYKDTRFDRPGYKWWEIEEDKRLSSHYAADKANKVLYAVLVSKDVKETKDLKEIKGLENIKTITTFDHHILPASIDGFKSFVDSIEIFPGLSKYEYERFGWWFDNKVKRELI